MSDSLESIITRGFGQYLAVRSALAGIREGALYRDRFASFEDYLCGRWQLSRPVAEMIVRDLDAIRSAEGHR